MATVLDIIKDALSDIGEFGVGQSVNPEDSAFGLLRLNSMLDSWSTERLFIDTIGTDAYTLVPGQATYQLGVGASDFSSTKRLLKIESAAILLTVGTHVTRHDITSGIIPEEGWAMLRDQGALSSTPDKLYCDYHWPIAGLGLYPAPRCEVLTQLELGTWSALTLYGDLVTVLNLRPGYYEAIELNLGVALMSGYNKPPDPVLIQRAQDAKRRIQMLNAERMANASAVMAAMAAQQQANTPGTPQQQQGGGQ